MYAYLWVSNMILWCHLSVSVHMRLSVRPSVRDSHHVLFLYTMPCLTCCCWCDLHLMLVTFSTAAALATFDDCFRYWLAVFICYHVYSLVTLCYSGTWIGGLYICLCTYVGEMHTVFIHPFSLQWELWLTVSDEWQQYFTSILQANISLIIRWMVH